MKYPIGEKNTQLTLHGDFKRFDRIGATSAMLKSPALCQTVVKVKKENFATTVTVRNVKWSKYRLLRWFQRLWIIIKYR